MTKNTFPVNGGAMPKIDRRAVMVRAWAIFRQTYGYPTIPFRSIGRPCFAWALKTAWAETRAAAQADAIPADVKAGRIAALESAITFERFNDHWQSASANIAAMRAEILSLTNQ